jgi:S1-C subfamily serine protease
VSFVVDDSAAAAAGITEGDLLLSIDAQPVAGQELR